METEKILLDIDFNSPEIAAAIKTIVEAKSAIDQLKASNAELAKASKQNSAEYVKNEQSIKALNTTVSQNSKLIQANTQATELNEDSIDALTKANKQLRIERNAQSTATEEGRRRIAELNSQIDSNTDKIKENVSGLEKQKINIGNYSSALDNLVPGLGSVTNNTTNFIQANNGLAGAFKAGTTAAGGLLKQLWLLVANPIGAIVAAIALALAALYKGLTSTAAGADMLSDAMAVISTIINVIVDRLGQFALALGKIFTGDFIGGFNQMKDAASGVADEIEREVRATLALEAALRDLEDAEIDYEVQAASTENQIKRLLLQAKNRTLAEEERIDLLNQALALEQKQNEQLIANADLALQIATDQAAMRMNIAQEVGESEIDYSKRVLEAFKSDNAVQADDLRDKLVEMIIARENAEGKSLALQEKIQNQVDAIQEKAEAAAEKRREKAAAAAEKEAERIKKLAEAEQKAAFDLYVLRAEMDIKTIKSISDRVNAEIALAKFKTDYELQQADLTASQELLIVQKFENDKTAIILKGDEDRAAIAKNIRETTKANNAEDLVLMTKQAEDELTIEVNALKEKLLNEQITKEEYDKEVMDAELVMLQAQQDIKEVFGQEDIALAGRITDAKIAKKKYEVDTEKRLEQQKFQAVQQILAQSAALLNKNALAYKALSIAQATLNTYQAASLALSSYPPPFSFIAAALTVAAGIQNVLKIANTTVPKMEQGGMIDIGGKRHSAGGEDVHIGGKRVANVEAGEKMVILKRGANPDFVNKLGMVNQLAGGINFGNDRAPRRFLQDGGFVSRAVSAEVRPINNKSLSDAVVDGVKAVKIYTDVTDVTRMQGKVAKTSQASELRS